MHIVAKLSGVAGKLEFAQALLTNRKELGRTHHETLADHDYSPDILDRHERRALAQAVGFTPDLDTEMSRDTLVNRLQTLSGALNARTIDKAKSIGLDKQTSAAGDVFAAATAAGWSTDDFQLACETLFLQYLRAYQYGDAERLLAAYPPGPTPYAFDVQAMANGRLRAALAPAAALDDLVEGDLSEYMIEVTRLAQRYAWAEEHLRLAGGWRTWLYDELHPMLSQLIPIPQALCAFISADYLTDTAHEFVDDAVDQLHQDVDDG